MPAGSTMRAIEDRGRLVAGVSGDRLLLGALDPLTDQLAGFEVDLLRQVAVAIFGEDGHLELRVVAEADAPSLLQAGALDVAVRGMTITCGARQAADFSAPYYRAAQRVLLASGSPATGIEDLRGKHVCVAAGSPALAAIAAAPSRPIPVPVPDWTECLVRFQQGRVDAISADDALLLGFARQDPYARIVGGDLAEEPYGIAVARDHPDLVRFLNGWLEGMRAGGGWNVLAARWLAGVGPLQQPPARYAD
jgi:polar amino acid transport system substrate-binding protein